MMRSTELARRAQVGRQTLRYYERRGLLSAPGRSANGYRDWPESSVGRLRFIKRAQALGFELDEVAVLLELGGCHGPRPAAVRELAQSKLGSIERRLAELERVRAALARLVSDCERDCSIDGCPIVEALAQEEPL